MVISEDQELWAVGDCELVGVIKAGLPRQHTVIAKIASSERSISVKRQHLWIVGCQPLQR